MADRISVNKVRKVIEARIAACRDAAATYEGQADAARDLAVKELYGQMAATERCAMLELRYVLGKLAPSSSGRSG